MRRSQRFIFLLLVFLISVVPLWAAETYTQKTLYIDGVTTSDVAFSPDGSRFAIASSESVISIRDTHNDAEVRTFTWAGKRTGGMAFSPDDARLAMISYNKDISLWDLSTGKMLAEAATSVPLGGIVFSPDGARLMAPGQDGKAHLFDAATLAETAVIAADGALIAWGNFSPDGQQLATINLDQVAQIWDIDSGKEIARFSHEEHLRDVSFSYDGSKLGTAGRNGQVKVFDLVLGSELLSFSAGADDINAIVFSPDGSRLATASTDTIGVWDAATGAAIASLKGNMQDISSVLFGGDSRTLYSTDGPFGRIWRVAAPAQTAGDSSSLAGLWRQSFDLQAGETLPPEVVTSLCQAPVRVQANGLVLFYEFYPPDAPRVAQHFRCGPDMNCSIFAGAPAQGLDSFGTVTLKEEGGKLSICGNGECQVFERCDGPITWGAEDKASGYEKVWNEAVEKMWE